MGTMANGGRIAAMISAAALLSACFGYESAVDAVEGARADEPPFPNGVYCATGWDDDDDAQLTIDRSECIEFAWLTDAGHYLVGELGLEIEPSILEIGVLPDDEFLLQMSEEDRMADDEPRYSLLTGMAAEGGFMLMPQATRDEFDPLLEVYPDVNMQFGQYSTIRILGGAPESIRAVLAQADAPWREAVRQGEADWTPYRNDPGPLWFIRVNDVHSESQERAALAALAESIRAALGAPESIGEDASLDEFGDGDEF